MAAWREADFTVQAKQGITATGSGVGASVMPTVMTTTSTSITAVPANGDQNEEDNNNSSSSNNSVIGDDDDVNAPPAIRTTAISTEMILSIHNNVVSRPPPPPPLRFIEIDPNARYPPPPSTSPPPPPLPLSVGTRTKKKKKEAGSSSSSILNDAEELVRCAIASRHELVSSIRQQQHSSSSAAASATSSSSVGEGGGKATDNVTTTTKAAKSADMIIYKTNTDAATHLTDLLMRRIHNAYLLHAALTILPICDSGRALDQVASYPKLHARTIHLLMILDPFIPDGIGNSSNSSGSGGGKVVGGGVGVEELRRIDIARRERHKQTTNNNNNNNSTTTNRQQYYANNLSPKAVVQIAEPSIRHKEDTQYILPNILYFNYSIADAHFRLLIALVSCNSTYGPPVVRTLWTLLTDFGSRWKEYMVSYNNKLGHEEDRVNVI